MSTRRGAARLQPRRHMVRFRTRSTVGLRKHDTLRAGGLMGVAAVGLPESIRLANAQQKTVERGAQLKQDREATKGLHRLSALQGKLLDAAGTTVLMEIGRASCRDRVCRYG